MQRVTLFAPLQTRDSLCERSILHMKEARKKALERILEIPDDVARAVRKTSYTTKIKVIDEDPASKPITKKPKQ